MAIKNLGKHAGQNYANPLTNLTHRIFWIFVISISLIFLSTSAVYATGNINNTDINGDDAPPHEQISDLEDPTEGVADNPELTEEEIAEDLAAEEATKATELPTSQYKVSNYNTNATDGFTISWCASGSQTASFTTDVHYGTIVNETYTSIEPFVTKDIKRNFSRQSDFGNNIYKASHFDVRYFEETYTDSNGKKWAYAGSYLMNGETQIDMTKFGFSNATTLYYLDDLKNGSWQNVTKADDVEVYLVWKDVTEWDQASPDFTVQWTGNTTTPLPEAKVQYMYHDVNASETTYKHLDPPFAGNLQLTRATSESRSSSHTMTMSNYTGRYVDQYIGKDAEGKDVYKPCVYNKALIAVPTSDPSAAIWVEAYDLFYSYMQEGNRWYFATASGGTPTRLRDGAGGTSGEYYTGTEIWINLIYEYSDDYVAPGLDSRGMGVKINVFDYDSWLNASGSFADAINVGNAFKFVSGSDGSYDPWNTYTGGTTRRAGIWKNLIQREKDEDPSPGYPSMVDEFSGQTVTGNIDLKYLLDEYDSTYKKAYNDITGLFDKAAYDKYGYYAYGSNNFTLTPLSGHTYSFDGHFAQMRKKSDGLSPTNNTPNANLRDNFVLYKNPSTGQAATDNRLFMPFDDKDNPSEANSDFHFGMYIETPFVQPEDGESAFVGTEGAEGSPMIFHFNGDDDVFVYFDDVLLLDLGGIHQRVAGDINFQAGTITITAGGTTTEYMDDRWFTARKADMIEKYEDVTDSTTWQQFFANHATDEGWEEVGGASSHYRYADYTSHVMKFYYFERGTGQSNCEIAFNLQTMPEGTVKVEKKVEVLEGQIGYLDGDFYYKVEVNPENTGWKAYYDPTNPEIKYEVYDSATTQLIDTRTPEEGGKIHIHDGQYAYLYGFHNGDKFKVAECDPKYTVEEQSGEIDLLWKVLLKFGHTPDYIEPPNKIHFDSDNTDWWGTDELVSGNDNTNVVVFKNQVNAEHLFDLKINKEKSNEEITTLKVSFNGETDAEGKPINTEPYNGKYNLVDKNGQIIEKDLVAVDGIVQVADEQTVVIENIQMNTRAYVEVVDPYRQGTFKIHEFDPDTQTASDWQKGDMSSPYPDGTSPFSTEEFAARIPMVNFETFPLKENRYGEIKFSLTNDAENLTIEKTVNSSETTQLNYPYKVSALLYTNTGGTTPYTPAAGTTYEAWYYQKVDEELVPTEAVASIDNTGQILIKKISETVDPYIPQLKNGEKIVVYSLFPDVDNPIQSVKVVEENVGKTQTAWAEFWSASAKLNDGTASNITGNPTDDYWYSSVITVGTTADTPQSLTTTNTFREPIVHYPIAFDFYQNLVNHASSVTMQQAYNYSMSAVTSGAPMPVTPTFTLTGTGSDSGAHKQLTTETTEEITEETIYQYNATVTSLKPDNWYVLDTTTYKIVVTVDPTAAAGYEVTVEYYIDTAKQDTATWTHEHYGAYTIPFDYYQVLVEHASPASMQQAYNYSMSAVTSGAPMPATPTFTLTGTGSNPDAHAQLTALTTAPILTTSVSYEYSATITTEKPDNWYVLDTTTYKIVVTITPSDVQAASDVSVAYSIGDTPATNATWTHHHYGAYTIPFDFYQVLVEHASTGTMQQTYNYNMSAITTGAPMPASPEFTLTGTGTDSGAHTQLTALTTAPILTESATYEYSATLKPTSLDQWYVLDTTTYKITVTITPSGVQAASDVSVAYSIGDTPATNATWTHEHYGAYTIPFDFYQVLVEHASPATMQQAYNYSMSAVTSSAPMPVTPTFTLTGTGSDSGAHAQLTALTTAPILTTSASYEYSATITTEKPDNWYVLDTTIYKIVVTITPSDVQAASDVSVAYSIGDTPTTNATWTHHHYGAYPITFNFYQKLINNTEDEMLQKYAYILKTNNGNAPMPENPEFTIEGGEESTVETQVNTETKEPITEPVTYKYKAHLTTERPSERYVLDNTTYFIDVTVDPTKPAGEEISYEYSTESGPAINATWTHVFNPVQPEPIPPIEPEYINGQTGDSTAITIAALMLILCVSAVAYTASRKMKKHTPKHAK